MPTEIKAKLKVVDRYTVAADEKKRISLRGAKTKYFEVNVLSDGSYLLQPRILVPPQAFSARTLKMLSQSVTNLKRGVASEPLDLSQFAAD